MKQMTCAQMGGPADCDVVISGSTPEEMVDNGMKHLKKAHPEMAEQMNTMPKEAGEKWMAEFREKWELAPEVKV